MLLRVTALVIVYVTVTAAQGPLRLELKRFEQHMPGCEITFEYPEIVSAATAQARENMNRGILRLLLRDGSFPGEPTGFRSLNEYAADFAKLCVVDRQMAKPLHALYLHKRVKILRTTPPVLSLSCDSVEDAGGVHPFGTTFFVNFDQDTGMQIALKDLLKEGALQKLNKMAEERFRREHQLSASESLEEQSYTFPDDHFRLNDNFALAQDDLVFLFNVYEIGPGAMPATEIRIPYVFLRGMLNMDLEKW